MRILNKNESTSATKSERNSINESKNQKSAAIYFVWTYGCLHTSVHVCGCAELCFFRWRCDVYVFWCMRASMLLNITVCVCIYICVCV